MDLNKSYEYFQPESVRQRIHIIGCGSVGSTVAENLARCGLTKFTLWDFDKVESKNIVNQMFREQDVGKPKVEALRDLILDINPEAKNDIKLKPDGWQGELVSGYVFLAVDSVKIRREFCEKHMASPNVKAVFDFRTLLESAQHFAADWSDLRQRENLMRSMEFSDEDAEDAVPVSACGTVLGVATTVRLICALGVDNFLNFVKDKGLKKMVIIDGFNFTLTAF